MVFMSADYWNVLVFFAIALFLIVVVALIATASSSSTLAARLATLKKNVQKMPVKDASKPAVKPQLTPLAVRPAPRIIKVEEKPVLKPLSIVAPIVALVESVAQPEPAELAKKVEPEVVAAPVLAPAPVEDAPVEAAPVDTFDAYRTAMLSSGPRAALSEESRVQMQQKGRHANSAQWREQTATLRSALRNESAASFLEGMNTSVNDRMVAIFDSVRA
jgi:hypothetical protein